MIHISISMMHISITHDKLNKTVQLASLQRSIDMTLVSVSDDNH